MVRGFYTAGSAILTRARALDVISNNVSNLSTSGFKKDSTVQTTFGDQLAVRLENDFSDRQLGEVSLGVTVGQVTTDFSNGGFRQTDSPFDLAIKGEGFFGIINENNQIILTRNGHFFIDDEGYIANNQGRLLGANGAINTMGNLFKVLPDGEVLVDNNPVDRIALQVPNDYNALVKLSDGCFINNGGQQGADFGGEILQGYYETSNVDMIDQMLLMMSSQRMIQSCSQVVRMIDSSLQKALEVGRL